MTKFPKTLYVKMEQEGDITYPVPSENLVEVADITETVRVGIYELRDIVFAECEIKLKKGRRS